LRAWNRRRAAWPAQIGQFFKRGGKTAAPAGGR
jgi:hypothetical protein